MILQQLSDFYNAVGQLHPAGASSSTFMLHCAIRALPAALDDVLKDVVSSGTIEKFHSVVQSNCIEARLVALAEALGNLSPSNNVLYWESLVK
jgi:hypothetical protein